ncbi:KaiC domain-containing protein [Halorubrum sp. DTA46]|uniref:KaiC domain-containing protein n=1 Tax=Halorubrum sp. DTA46 TaxID=3402162 RepID=UPI003AAE6A7E
MSEEDDWFERAIRDLEADAESDGANLAAVDGEDSESDAVDGGDSDATETPEDDPSGGRGTPDDQRGDTADTADDDAVEEHAIDESAAGVDVESGSFGESDPFGGAADDSPPVADSDHDSFDGGSAEPFGSDSADPFGGYRGAAQSSDDDFGFGDFGSGAEDEVGQDGDSGGFDVDPDEFESSIERTDIGIKGLDEMILGGVPRRSLLSVIGGAGTGKTTFALQFLNEALESDRNGVYITLEQTRESILSTAEEKGWSFREHADADRLAVVAIDPIEMANSLASIRNDLTRLIAEFDADRLVLDSVSLLEMMYDHPSKRRSEVFGFTRSLKEAGVTTLLTSEASETNPYASRHGIVEYLTDAVFVLQYIRGSDFRETRLAVEIQKIRDANHSRETKPYEITDTGISVYGQANIF